MDEVQIGDYVSNVIFDPNGFETKVKGRVAEIHLSESRYILGGTTVKLYDAGGTYLGILGWRLKVLEPAYLVGPEAVGVEHRVASKETLHEIIRNLGVGSVFTLGNEVWMRLRNYFINQHNHVLNGTALANEKFDGNITFTLKHYVSVGVPKDE